MAIIEAALEDRVLVVGSLPPAGRDLDLLARAAECDAIAATLARHGFERDGRNWVAFADCRAHIVELIAAQAWGLQAAALDALYASAVPLDGCRRLVRPGPAHELLIVARKARRTRRLERKLGARVDAALAADPGAWQAARALAPSWDAQAALDRLERRHARPAGRPLRPRWLRRPRRGAIVALSGLDGAGKSTQASALQATLAQLGRDAVVVWTPLGHSRTLRRGAAAIKRALARLPFARIEPGEHLLSHPGSGGPGAHGAAVAVWSTLTALANVAAFSRAAAGALLGGRIVIFDRYVLDSVVQLRFAYGALPFQEALIRRCTPRPTCAFLLDVAPETAVARKRDWSLAHLRQHAEVYRREHAPLGVRRVDGSLPRQVIAAILATEVWRALRR